MNKAVSQENMIDCIVKIISSSNITNLDTKGNQLGTLEAKKITKALESNKTLTELNLLGSKIKEEGVKEFAAGLKNNSTFD